ncbi:hypothetical protein LWT37_22210, partial [Enterobacter hormaechei]|nr:hypothetical protein [Enterobacter hormaechei]
YISEFQKSKSEKAIESMNKALNIINNTPEGLTLIDANKYPYDKKHTTNVGIIELTSRVMINSQKNLNNFLNNEIKKSDDFWNEIGNKYQRAVRNLFLYYREMKAKLSRALTTEVARLKRIKEDLEKSRIEINEAIHDGQNTAIPPSVKQLIFAKLYPKEALEIGLFSKGSTNITTNAVRFATQGDEKKGTFTQPKEMQGEGTQVNAFRHMIWQATLAARYGEKIAKHAGDAHEVDPRVDLNIRQFAVLNDADQTIDLLNNQIGRHIGLNSNTTSMKTLALIALEKFHKEG